MSDYNTTQSDYREKCKARIQRQLEISELMWYCELKAFNLLVLLVAIESWILKGNTKLFKMQNFNFCRLFCAFCRLVSIPVMKSLSLFSIVLGYLNKTRMSFYNFSLGKFSQWALILGTRPHFSWHRFRHNVSCYGKLWDFEAFTWNLL